MGERSQSELAGWIRHLPLLAGACVAALGAAALIGWAEDIAWLESLSPRFVSMKANAAAGFVALGLSLMLAGMSRAWPTRVVRWALEVTVLALGVATLTQYVAGTDLGIDQLLFPAPLNEFQTVAQGRMSAIGAACLALAAIALLAERAGSPRGIAVARTLATCVGIVGLLSLLGYLYGAPVLYRPLTETTAMALQSAVASILLASGTVALHPEYGLPSIATGRTLVGTHVRWLFPTAVLIPLLIGGIAVQTYETFGVARVSIAITAAGTTITIGLAIGLAALWLRRMEDSLEVSNRALAATRQGVFIAEGSRPGRPIVYVNEAFLKVSGYSQREALGRDCGFFVAADTDEPAARELRASFDARADCTVVLPCKRKDGTVFSGRLSVSAVPGSDGADHVVGLLEDVTAEQLAAKARLELLAEASQARKDAEAANRVKDTFFATVTHELRSPLNACLMWLDVLALGPLSAKAAKAVDAITRNLKIQTRLVNDLIDAAKISSGGIEIHPETFDAAALIENSVETWQLLAATHEVKFDYAVEPGEYPLNADSERLLQVLNNLLENAFNHTPAGGRVELELSRAPNGVRIDVSDTGAGLSTEEIERVFTPFWRGKDANPEHKGLGLGLAIAEHLIKGHRGNLRVSSEGPGKGCTFSVYLPYASGGVYGATAAQHLQP